MAKRSNQDYKNAVFEQLAKGEDDRKDGGDHFEHFENVSPGTQRSEGEAVHPERLSSEQTEPEFLHAASNMNPQERAEIARDFVNGLQERGVTSSWLARTLGLGSDDPSRASAEDVARLSEYARQKHPEVFQRVVADKPFFVRWLSKPLVAALAGVIAGKLLNRAYDREG